MINVTKLLAAAICTCVVSIGLQVPLQAQSCSPLPNRLTEGHLENVQFGSGVCYTLAGLSSGGWNVCPGTPSWAPGSFGSSQGITLIAASNGETEGVYSCVNIKPHSKYFLRFDIATAAPFNPGEIHVYAANGLAITSGGCQGTLPTPSSSLHITTESTSSFSYQTVELCFETTSIGFEQLWFYAGYPNGSTLAQNQVMFDNVEIEEITFDLVLDGQSNSPVNLCEGRQTNEIFLQVIDGEIDCSVEQYQITVYENGNFWGHLPLGTVERSALLGAGLDLRQLVFGIGSIPFAPHSCYDIEVIKVSNCCNETSQVITVCIEDCACDFNAMDPFTRSVGPDYEQLFGLGAINNPNVDVLTADWDFGDGSSAHGLNVTHKFQPGFYVVCVTIYAVDRRSGECCEHHYCEGYFQGVTPMIAPDQDEPRSQLPTDHMGREVLELLPNANSNAELFRLTPNPASGSSTLTYLLPDSEFSVSADLFDVHGRMVRQLLSPQPLASGQHELLIETQDLPNGVYFVRMLRDNVTVTLSLQVNN